MPLKDLFWNDDKIYVTMIVGIINKIDLNLVIICFLSITFNACHKIEREAKIVTKGVSEVTATSVKASGEIIDLGEGISRYGHILYDQQREFLSQSFANTSAAIGFYTTIINGLNPNTTYYVSAYAETSKRTVYGNLLSFTTIGYPPVAAFTGSPTTVAPGQSVQFTDQSTNNPTSWSWNFGDGNTSTTRNPSHTYVSSGSYVVSLTVTNNYGSDTETRTGYITVGNLPVAAFTGSPTTVAPGQSVQFTDQSTNNPTSWSWNFGDGSTANTSRNPTHTYNSPGNYTVTLTVTNSYGSDAETKTGYIIVGNSPVAEFTGSPRTITTGQSVQFTDQSTNNPTSWSWNFGDGGTSTSHNPSHVYNSAGSYTVTLTATNSYGSDNETKSNYITVEELSADNYIDFIPPSWLGGEIIVRTDICNTGTLSHTYVLTAEIYNGNTQVANVGQKTTAMILPGYSEELTFYYNIPHDWEARNYNFRIIVWSGTPFSSIILDDDTRVFTIEESPTTVKDIDGNVYNIVTIGTQVWMAENLRTTRYNDGSSIPLVSGNTAWNNLTTAGYCWYNNDATTYKNVYGALYNWYVVNTNKLCPFGWHVPNDNEWTSLISYLGNDSNAGGKLKATGTIEEGTGLWSSPNTGATNETNFTALPGGYRHRHGSFYSMGQNGNWWSESYYGAAEAWYRTLHYYNINVDRYSNYKTYGFSVRCVRNTY